MVRKIASTQTVNKRSRIWTVGIDLGRLHSDTYVPMCHRAQWSATSICDHLTNNVDGWWIIVFLQHLPVNQSHQTSNQRKIFFVARYSCCKNIEYSCEKEKKTMKPFFILIQICLRVSCSFLTQITIPFSL